MKQKRLTNYLKIGILLFGISLLLTNCEKDDSYQEKSSSKTEPNITIKTLRKDKIQNKKGLLNKLSTLETELKTKSRTNKNSNREIYSEEYDFTINTDYCKEIFDGSKYTYTFPVYREQDSSLMENLWLIEEADSTYRALLVQYDFTQEEIESINLRQQINTEGKISYTKLDSTEIIGDILGKYYYDGSCYEDEYVYQQANNCASGNHTFADGGYSESNPDGCHYWGTTDMATTGGYVLTPVLVPCDNTGGGGDNGTYPNGDPNNDPHGGGSTGGSTTPITCKTCPELEDTAVDGLSRECNKISDLFSDFPDYKQDLINLAQTVDQQVENGIFVDDNSSNTQNIPQGLAGKLNINMTPQNDYVSIAHTHDASGTYSVFSWDDLTTIANLVRTGKIKTNKFVAFLITEKGTRYAFTISSSTKFLDFFYNPQGGQGTVVDTTKLLKMEKVYNDFYKDNNAPIKENNSNNTEVRNAFLEMLRDNNIGLDIFTMDENFENFQKLNLESDNTTITPENCN